ncbi:ABC transporter permease [Alkaliphilus peptidifermentans]|uniref:MacB-like periplasmic core domain-containing protein n=1 Tax=Alkaliphilus peptidifermentans DSM 18978 TaxID=1120976 RepID=A0A1G5BL25_9FIRM|nr:ABC transporter permease [Alkaliphilus peptidifermentans]SCX90817.1 hypothetical protein SAMN03080606_00450 [Alkaliphilus peptidifermentans DSM 18978]
MVIKRIYILTLIILCSLTGYFYLQENHNPYSVEVFIEDLVTHEKIKEIAQSQSIIYSLNYEIKYRNENVMMTTGYDTMFKNINVIEGNFITMADRNAVVIGDLVSNSYYRTSESVGRNLTILGKEHIVIGVIEDSTDIYVSYDEKLLNRQWDRIILRFMPPSDSIFDRKVEDVKRVIDTNGIRYSEMIVLREKIDSYVNYIIAAIIGILITLAIKPGLKLINDIKRLYKGYKENHKTIEWYRYIINNKKSTLKICILLGGGVIVALIMYQLTKIITIPKELIPDNLFSPVSYINQAKSLFEIWYERMNRGFSHFLINRLLVNFSMIAVIFAVQIKWLLKDPCQIHYEGEQRIEN